jgi:fluoride exporter
VLTLMMIGLGGAAGAYSRYRLATWIFLRTEPVFPWGTLAVNMTGSFALGLLLPAVAGEPAALPLRALLTVGFLGAFTTFSSFSLEAVSLAASGRASRAALYIGISLALGLVSIAAGLWLGTHLI